MSLQSIQWKDDFFLSLKDELGETAPVGTTLIRITNRILNDLATTIDLEPTIRTSEIYFCGDDFEKYASPTGMKSGALIDLRPRDSIVDRPIRLISPLRFAKYNAGEWVALQRAQGLEYLKILHDQFSGNQTYISACETSLTADGAWTAGTGALNITHDSYTFKKGNGAINFDVATGAPKTATISFVKSTVIDISGYTAFQRIRFFMKLPTAPSSISVRWGSDSSNYYAHSITTQTSGESFSTNDWNELEAAKNSATITGTPDDENMDYFALVLTFASATTDTDFLIDNIKVIKPEVLIAEYYSYYMARSATGTYGYGLTISADTTDLLEILNEWRDLIVFGVCARYLRSTGGKTAMRDSLYYTELYERQKLEIKRNYPSRRSIVNRKRLLPRLSR